MILITRPSIEGKLLSAELKKDKLPCVQEPLTNFKFVKIKKIKIDDKVFIISSLQAVKAMSKQKKIYAKLLYQGRILVIGQKVKEELHKIGAKKIEKVFLDSCELTKFLKKNKKHKHKLEYLCSNIVNNEFINSLKAENIQIRKKIIYQTIPSSTLSLKTQKLMSNDKIKIVLFFSKFSAQNFLKKIRDNNLESSLSKIVAVCISDRVAKYIIKCSLFEGVKIAKNPNQISIISLLKSLHF